jgi:hypothetical protein
MDKQEQILAQLEKLNTEISCWKDVFSQAKRIIKQSENHEERITAVENSRIPIAAASAVIGGVFSHIIRLIF